MSSPIQPPGGPQTPDAPEGLQDGPDGPGEVFQRELQATRTPERSRLADLEQAVRAGSTTPQEAVDQLVQHALTQAAHLPEAERVTVEARLRAALAEDPALLALQRDLAGAAKD